MYRFVFVFAAVTALSLAATAQSPLADSSGVYLSLGTGYSTSTGIIGTAIAAGYRQQNGLEYGIGFELSRYGTASFRSFTHAGYGASLGYSTDIGLGAKVKAEGLSYYRTMAYQSELGEGARLDGSAVGIDLSASIARPVRLVGSLQLSPSIGAYTNVSQGFGVIASGASADQDLSGANAGAQLGLDLSFRLFGADVSIPIQGRIPVFGQRSSLGDVSWPTWRPSSSIRIDF